MQIKRSAQRNVIGDPAAWIGPEIQNDPSWIYRIDAESIEEIDAALAHAKRAGAPALSTNGFF